MHPLDDTEKRSESISFRTELRNEPGGSTVFAERSQRRAGLFGPSDPKMEERSSRRCRQANLLNDSRRPQIVEVYKNEAIESFLEILRTETHVRLQPIA